jgi:hypothetical protein
VERKKITELFKDVQIKIAFRMLNTIQNIIKLHPQRDKYNKSDIYQIKFPDCPLRYTGQTGRTFHTRYREHIQVI